MGRIIKEYQVIFGLALAALIFGLLFSGTIYLLGMRDKFTPPAYANPGFPSSKAVIAAFPAINVNRQNPGVWLVKADGSIDLASDPDASSVVDGTINLYKFAHRDALDQSKSVVAAFPGLSPTRALGVWFVRSDATLDFRNDINGMSVAEGVYHMRLFSYGDATQSAIQQAVINPNVVFKTHAQ